MKELEVKLPCPSFVQEILMRPLGCHMPEQVIRVRVEYGFECGCPEGILYFPGDADWDKIDQVEALLREIWGSVVAVREYDANSN